MSDEQRKLASADREIMESVETGEGLIEVTSVEQLRELAEAAQATHRAFMNYVREELTDERAAFVRRLRVDEHYSWRAVAEACYLEWDGDWHPPSNQLMGMALCQQAAEKHDENYMDAPWN